MTMRIVLICFLVIFACGHLAAASKSFGGGGYASGGGEAGAEAQVESAAQQAVEGAEKVAEESSGLTTTPTTTTQEGGGGGCGGSQQSQELPADEPLNGLNEKAIKDILAEHNLFRAKEHVPPLTWNTTLAKYSQDYAEKTLKKDCKMVHSDSPYGENLMLGSGAISWKTTVDTWSDEKKSYHYGANTCDPGKMCGHYTAVVWKDTTSVGCGRVLCDNKETMIMCSYWPPGNYADRRPF